MWIGLTSILNRMIGKNRPFPIRSMESQVRLQLVSTIQERAISLDGLTGTDVASLRVAWQSTQGFDV